MTDIIYNMKYSWNAFNNNYNDIQLKKSDIEKLMKQNDWNQLRAVYELVCRSAGRIPEPERYLGPINSGPQFAYNIVSADSCDIC